MNNIAIIQQGAGRYLFSVPENVTLKEGDRVKCDTKRGITDGIAFADSAWVDENISQLIGKLVGAKFPLKSVVGKLEYLPFEKQQAANPANKYEGMSNTQLKTEMCSRGSCSASNSWRRKHDCLFADDLYHDVTAANRADVIKYLLAEDAEAAPKPEDKQETVKLYCVKDFESLIGQKFSAGTIYTLNSDGYLTTDNGGSYFKYKSADNLFETKPQLIGVLVPLVKRPAKVGEYVLLDRDDCFHKNKQGDVVKVVEVPSYTTAFCFINDPTLKYSDGICVSFESNYSYVLDGYKPTPEAEPEPKYYNGKVVCVESCDGDFTVGKVYEFVNGKVTDNDGIARLMGDKKLFKSVEEWNEAFGGPIARFIEFKGEAHD